jgi:hypothetical protein
MSRHVPKLLIVPALALSSLLVHAAAFAQNGPAKCNACQTTGDTACGDTHQPRVICFDYASGALTWEGCSTHRPDFRLFWNDPVEVRVSRVNPYRHSVTVTIAEQTFQEIYTAPALVSSDLLPGKTSPSDKASGSAALADSNTATKAEKEKQSTEHGQSSSSAEKATPAGDKCKTLLKLLVFNSQADRLADFETFVADERARTLQIEDPTELTKQSQTAALAKATAATAKFTDLEAANSSSECPIPVPSSVSPPPSKAEDITPEYLIDLRTRLAAAEETAFADLGTAYGTAKKSGGADADLGELYAKAQKRHDSITSSQSQRDQQFASTMSVYANLLDPGFGCVLFGPVASTGDEVDVTLDTQLKAEAANFTLTPTPTATGSGTKKAPAATAAAAQVALVIPVIRHYAPSFSTGIVFTNLVDPTFSVTSSGTVVKKKPDQFLPALGAMINTPLAFPSPDLTIQWSLGVALKNSNPLYVTGPSVIIGRRQRTVVTAGLAGSQVTEVSGPVSGSTVPTQKAFRLGWFVGLSYNFGPTSTSAPAATTPSPKKVGG